MIDAVANIELIKNESLTNDIYIFPFDGKSKCLLMYLNDYNISVKGFVTEDANKVGLHYLNKEIVTYDSIKDQNCKIISYFNAEKSKNINDIVYLKYPEWFSPNIAAYREEGKDDVFLEPRVVHYLLSHTKGKYLSFVGKAKDVAILSRKLKTLGLNVSYGISLTDDVGIIDECEFKSIYDLLYENEDQLFVFVLKGAEDYVRNFIELSGISEKIFCCILFHKIYRSICFDPNLGFNNCYKQNDGIFQIGKKESKMTKTIAVLGGSTTDSSLYIEKSWPEFLYDNFLKSGIEVNIINAAVSGYSSSQELLKLIRDVIPQHPDFVISYSGVNEYGSPCENNYFIHKYQKNLFERIAKIYENESRDGSFMEPRVSYGMDTRKYGGGGIKTFF